MALDVYFREDVQNILLSTSAAAQGSMNIAEVLTGADGKIARAYQAGFGAALHAVALAFGIDTDTTIPEHGLVSLPASTESKTEDDGLGKLDAWDQEGFLWARAEYERQRGG